MIEVNKSTLAGAMTALGKLICSSGEPDPVGPRGRGVCFRFRSAGKGRLLHLFERKLRRDGQKSQGRGDDRREHR